MRGWRPWPERLQASGASGPRLKSPKRAEANSQRLRAGRFRLLRRRLNMSAPGELPRPAPQEGEISSRVDNGRRLYRHGGRRVGEAIVALISRAFSRRRASRPSGWCRRVGLEEPASAARFTGAEIAKTGELARETGQGQEATALSFI